MERCSNASWPLGALQRLLFLVESFFCAAVTRLSVPEFESAVNAGKSNKTAVVGGIYGGVTSSLRLLLEKFAGERRSAAQCDFSFQLS